MDEPSSSWEIPVPRNKKGNVRVDTSREVGTKRGPQQEETVAAKKRLPMPAVDEPVVTGRMDDEFKRHRNAEDNLEFSRLKKREMRHMRSKNY